MYSPTKGESKMSTCYVLIDYENIQPKDLHFLKDKTHNVKVFVGPSQKSLPVSLFISMLARGSNADCIQVETAGKNALDFHIAYYIGVLSAQDPSASFHILSKDAGFDSLVKHLNAKGIATSRSASVASVLPPAPLPPSSVPPLDEQVRIAVKDLIRRGASRPRTKTKLISTLNADFRKQLSIQQLSCLLDALCEQGLVKMDGEKVSYKLPAAGGTEKGTGKS
jgi:hypothetical protein